MGDDCVPASNFFKILSPKYYPNNQAMSSPPPHIDTKLPDSFMMKTNAVLTTTLKKDTQHEYENFFSHIRRLS